MSQPDPFQALVDALRRTLTTNPPSPSPVTSPSPAPAVTTVSTVSSPSPPVYASPMARPAPYSGSAEDCSGFLLQCELVLEMHPHLYPNDKAKIAFIISQLNGKALKWADSIWSQHGAVTQSYSAFISHFREVFGKPLTDSSAGEKLYNLKQGAMSIYDYALQFRTLAAVCGWNEQALITTYRQGLEPRVRLQLAACEDTIGLEKFIQHSIRCATCMQACLQEHQDQFLPIASLCRSEPVSSPEPANEPMDVENSRLTSSERQRRLTLHLSAAAARAHPKHTAARIHQPEERSPPDVMTSNTNVIVIRSLSPAPGKLRENKTFSNFPTSSSTSPMVAATVKPQHKQRPEPPGRDADSSSLGKSAKREQSKQQTNTQQCPQALCMRAPLQTENAQKNMYIQSQTLGHG
ncbi:Retrotransposon-derived protein PEG10 [Anabarilius grahami]|uniref:Retrotransposon-derived protein PEG10 n=1 Tax=Anabarilius grahami TaxID=495550 RepID=A0A3N0XXR8_ANAGA|nr:Retrotransposon-derived protein PEG10 [Anabarilius grahami]